ncbi:TIGR02646 family protein [Parashewanella spongiae]|uniref:TIGR02646 family protein n=1 Tax=Parashewanella spongiae TaxID=342950 RepID=A0A3A6TEG4_9GAMM|nr:retron system putative HNH endonuclease [Parashewanella spongiae]MCL1080050.1 TIGR02646 family protein [Parashewanella spongiae]RJY05210.1 TIGR02646 family protein [Parashewanella spongiae]
MRYIKKANGGNIRSLNAAQQSQQRNGAPLTADEATRAWGRFKDTDQQLLQKLLTEQFGLCCYTELNLADLKNTHGIGSHFEHEQPKHTFPHRTFDEANLLRCALDSEDLSKYSGENRFGGHYKDNNEQLDYDAAKFISPQSANCRDFFVYLTSDGSIHPKAGLSAQDNMKAQYTIDILNLNASFLKAERKRWLKEIDEEINKLIDKAATRQDRENLAECELTLTNLPHPELNKTAFPQLRPFHSATRALFGQLGENVIQQYCPQIN